MNNEEFFGYYSRPEIQEAIANSCVGREAVGRRLRGGYNRRPDVIQYPGDVLVLAKEGAVSFHRSVELWSKPLSLEVGMKPEDLSALRSGWDFLLDIDSDRIEHSRICADLVVQAFEIMGVRKVPVKFSGRAGFHIVLPFSVFPETWQGTPTRDQFPALPRLLAEYLEDFIKEKFAEKLSAFEGHKIRDPYKLVKFDSLLISSRHLCRCPYSLHEKSWLVSIPVPQRKVKDFDKEWAKPENVKEIVPFGEAEGSVEMLLEDAWKFKLEKDETEAEKKADYLQKHPRLPKKPGLQAKFYIFEEAFPPCIKNILNQKEVTDGRKRRLFTLMNFLSKSGRTREEVYEEAKRWNASLKTPLQDIYLIPQLNSFMRRPTTINPPNCENPAYYKDLQICTPNNFCYNIKNPLQCAVRFNGMILRQKIDEEVKKGAKKR